ncbi:MAG: MIP family channel protein [Clostridiales bacterium]|nr:MIP family channel protein [Clostridiales bacterium]
MKKYVAEGIGTGVLVFMGCGSAIFSGETGHLALGTPGGYLTVALAFGLSIVAMAYVIGNISGCHINPAVSFGMLLSKRMSGKDFVGYVIAQIIGAIVAAAILKGLAGLYGPGDQTGALGANGYGSGHGVGLGGALIVEIILTFIFVLVVLGVTADGTKGAVAGIVIGLTLTFVHIVGIPLTGTSVNPARSIGPALFAGGDALSQLWVFIVAPLAGAAVAALVYKFVVAQKAANAEKAA